nr:hypothetical protein [Tanacetum cinerariifolium]
TIRDVVRLDDVEGVECLPNEEIFAELARMGEGSNEVNVEDVPAEGAASVANDNVNAAVDKPSIPSPTPPTPPPQPSQDIPSTSQVQPTPPPQVQQPSPQQ